MNISPIEVCVLGFRTDKYHLYWQMVIKREKLKETVACVFKRSSPTSDIFERRNYLFKLFKNLIFQSSDTTNGYSKYGPIDVLSYGSINAGLDTIFSDIDLSLHFFHFDGDAESIKCYSSEILNGIAGMLFQNTVFQSICSIEKRTSAKVRVPVLKIKQLTAGITLDVSIENINAQKKTRLLCTCGDIDPRFRELVKLVKYWAHCRRINDAAAKTLSSFAYTLSVLQFLQILCPPILPCLHDLIDANCFNLEEYSNICAEFEIKFKGYGEKNSQTTEDLLLQYMFFMLEMCSESNAGKCISVRHGMLKPVAECYFGESSLCIEDVFDSTVNVAISVTPVQESFLVIKREFLRAYQILKEKGDFIEVCLFSPALHA
jgi:DNA polymerase sigma